MSESFRPLSRREVLTRFLRPFGQPLTRTSRRLQGTARQGESEEREQVAVIQGRYCLAYTGSFCSSCREHCPIPGAIVMHDGTPQVQRDACTGCAICQEICPAPKNAILLLPKPNAANENPGRHAAWRKREAQDER